MKEYRIHPEGNSTITFFGRTLYDAPLQAMFFNWTASGFMLAFKGTQVDVETVAFSETYPGEGPNLPYISVFLDGQPMPLHTLRVEEGVQRLQLYAGDQPQAHTLRVVKRSENSKGRLGLKSVRVEGQLTAASPRQSTLKLEFIGDSITCGFGNDMAVEDTIFNVAKENAFTAYPAVTAELLGADYQCVCISGIPLCWAVDPEYRIHLPEFDGFTPPVRTMEDYYAFTDRNHQESVGMCEAFTPWDFQCFRPDAIIVNLGTNDSFRLRVSGCMPVEEAHFTNRYVAFLHQLRRLNGAGPVLACIMGSMDYYLYDAIEKAVAQYRNETGDSRVFCMKFAPIDPWGEGFGGLGHPNSKTQIRMGHEMAETLRPWLKRKGNV
jgi:hypothetical protein